MKLSKTLIFISLFQLSQVVSSAQGSSRLSPDLQLQYFKDNKEQSFLLATLTISMNRMAVPVTGTQITFYAGTGERTKLGEIKTDNKGQSLLNLTGLSSYPKTSSNLWTFTAIAAGNDTLDGGESSVAIRDLKLQMDTVMVDSVRTISIKAFKADNNKFVPAEGVQVKVYVPRMFSLLPVGDISIDATGSGTLEFPRDIPGDNKGNITILAKVEDDPDFGNLEKEETVKWGIPPMISAHAGHRALWTKTPPTWMIVTLTVLLMGVWGHYLYTIICLVRIKRESRGKGKVKKVEQFIKSA
jgi:hypothetical protein